MIGRIFLLNAVVILALAVALWTHARRNGDPSFVDACWGFGFVVIAGISFLAADEHTGRGLLITVFTSVWGLRLGTYLLWRWRRHGADKRYDSLRDRMLTHVFLLQAALMLVVSLPVQVGQAYVGHAGPMVAHAIGAALVPIGLFFEWTADFQLTRFKADEANEGKVMDRGLWRYSRHPNYFGDFCVWWGLFFLSVSTTPTFFAVVGPIVMSVLLMRVSGVGPLEQQLRETKPKYKEYVATTSAFFPLPRFK